MPLPLTDSDNTIYGPDASSNASVTAQLAA